MKVPSISRIVRPIKKTLIGAMIALPTMGTMQSCRTVLLTREVPVVINRYPGIYHKPPVVTYRYIPQPPPKRYSVPHKMHVSPNRDKVDFSKGKR